MTKRSPFVTFLGCNLLVAGLSALILGACATADPQTTILQNSAALLRTEGLEAEAKTIEDAVARSLESLRRGEDRVDLGFAPDKRLKDYASQLREMKRDKAASKLEEYAQAYSEKNKKAFLFQKSVFQQSQARSLLGDRLIVPGERIGQLRLKSKIEELSEILGKGILESPGFGPRTTLYTWDLVGLWVVAEDGTGEIIWISVGGSYWGPKNPWVELSTREGLRIGSPEDQVLTAMGVPSRSLADASARNMYFEQQGIAFTLPLAGALSGKVATIRVFRPGFFQRFIDRAA